MSDCCRLFDSCLLLIAELLALNAYWQPDSCGAFCLQVVPIFHPPTSAEHDRIWSFRQFRSMQIPRNTPERRSMRLVWMARPVSLCDRCLRRHVTGLVMGAAQSWQRFKLRESPVKHGVELTGGFQFHLPPVFRPPASASLNLPPAEGHEENGAAHDTPPPRNTA